MKVIPKFLGIKNRFAGHIKRNPQKFGRAQAQANSRFKKLRQVQIKTKLNLKKRSIAPKKSNDVPKKRV